MKYIFNLINLVFLVIILQIVYFLFLIYTLANLSPFIFAFMWVFGIFTALFIVSGKDAAIYRLSWAVRILIFPAVMGLVYLFYNRRVTGRKIEADLLTARKNSLAFLEQNNKFVLGHQENKRLADYIEKTTGLPPASYTKAEYFPIGEAFHIHFLNELKKAEKYIFIEFFIIEQGKMWNEILSILHHKVCEGVDVRVIYDGWASNYILPRGYYKTLRKMGIKCITFNPLRSLLSFRLNTRNHRKIAVIDGVYAFCGGLNLCDKYINSKRPVPKTGHWKDSAVMVHGDAAWNMTLSFLSMWEFLSRVPVNYTHYIPAHSNSYQLLEGTMSFWSDIPLDNEPVSERVFLNFINRANKYVYITTPYLSPSEEILNALEMAARMGVDVRIIVPFLPDRFLTYFVSKSNYRRLLEAGVKIFEYSPGFIHAKNIIADDLRVAVSTVNFDYRSLYMNHECGICFYGQNMIDSMKLDFINVQKYSYEKTLEALENEGLFKRGLQRFCRIFSPLI